MTTRRLDSFSTKKTLSVKGKDYVYFSLKELEEKHGVKTSALPNSLKVLLENLLRSENGTTVVKEDILAMKSWLEKRTSKEEINYHPARVLMQDFTGVPAVVDLAAMRDAMKTLGGDPQEINPQVPVDLVIDHSVAVDHFASPSAFEENVKIEFDRNKERYEFLKWGQGAFKNFRVVPPGTGICHQVNLESLGQVVWTKQEEGQELAYCDTLVGTDSHTTMINGLSVLGWGVGGIEAEAAMLGQAVTMLIPEVVGFKLTGELAPAATATDLVLTVVQMLRAKGVVGKFVEFYGEGLTHLSLADRATIANMAPEYGATCGFFPIDEETLSYLSFTGRDPERVALVEAYAKEQGLWRKGNGDELCFTDTLELDLSKVVPSIAGPKRPQDRIELTKSASSFAQSLKETFSLTPEQIESKYLVEGEDYQLQNGDVAIAAITSCTNTSNPSVMLAAGLVAKKASELGLKVKPWVKTSLAPGSKVVSDYLEASGLQKDLDNLGFNLVGYGCTTCIGNSGPLPEKISKCVRDNNMVVTSVLSGNRNFEGRISQDIKANYLASPPLVVAYALAGSMNVDITKEPIAQNTQGKDIYLADIWPSQEEVKEVLSKALTPQMFQSRYSNVFEGEQKWKSIATSSSETYSWDSSSTYVQHPPYFESMTKEVPQVEDIIEAKVLALLGDSVTTDHISPAGSIKEDSPAGRYLKAHNVPTYQFNSYGSRRGNHEVMMRGTFANIRIKNKMVPGVEGGYTKFLPTGEVMSIYDAAMKYIEAKTPLVVIAGKEYGTGSSRDWAAKGTLLQGVKAVIASSFERIHRSNLIGMGVLPLQFQQSSAQELGLTGEESFTIEGLSSLSPSQLINVKIRTSKGEIIEVKTVCRIDTANELEFYRNKGILHYVLRDLSR